MNSNLPQDVVGGGGSDTFGREHSVEDHYLHNNWIIFFFLGGGGVADFVFGGGLPPFPPLPGVLPLLCVYTQVKRAI